MTSPEAQRSTLSEQMARNVPPAVRERGADIVNRGLVRSFANDGDDVRAEVLGTNVYDVHLRAKDQRLQYGCTCRYFIDHRNFCKHVWAVLLTADKRNTFPSLVIAKTDVFLPTVVRPISDAPLPGAPSRSRTRSGGWRDLLRQIPAAQPAGGKAVPDQMLYVISSSFGALMLEICGRSRTKNGEWTVVRPVSLTWGEVRKLSAVHREILVMIEPTGREYDEASLVTRMTLRPAGAPRILSRIAEEGALYVRSGSIDDIDGPLEWDGAEPWRFSLRVSPSRSSRSYQIEGVLRREGEERRVEEFRLVTDGIAVIGSTVSAVEDGGAEEWLHLLAGKKQIEIPEAEADDFVRALSGIRLPPIELPPELSWQIVELEPRPILRIRRSDGYGETFVGEPSFRYGELEVPATGNAVQAVQGRTVFRRNATEEKELLETLASFNITRDFYGRIVVRPAHLYALVSGLISEGWVVELDDRIIRGSTEVDIELQSGIDWFDLDGTVQYESERVKLPRLLSALRKNQQWIELSDGTLGIVPAGAKEQFEAIADLTQEVGGKLRFRRYQATLIEALLASRGSDLPDIALQLRESFARTPEPHPEKEPVSFQGSLRPYQREGLGWMQWLDDARFGGCLADDMGLGKTVQVLAHLEKRRAAGAGPSLVVAPKSLVFNWHDEAARFAPRLRVLEYHGSTREQHRDKLTDYDLVLTTYGTLREDVPQLSEVDFDYVIVDEAQAIKNPSSQISKAVRLLRGRRRLALTGTPVENRLTDLWSIFEFLNPSMLGSARTFSRMFVAKSVPPERRELLANALRPFLLRRTKEQVASELPQRVEQTIFCELDTKQRKKYDELRDHYRATLLKKVEASGIGSSKMHVLEALLRLRQAACHPALLTGDSREPSAKLDALVDELREVIAGNHRALVFSQFTTFLKLVGERLSEEKLQYLYLDGATKNRKEIVDQFQSPGGPPLFLISLKAGGVGLNLTAADYVFILDPWWNPAVEAQAVDRTHRIGQTRPVVAYRLIARDTVEEKILELQESKRELAESIITEDNSVLQKMDVSDLEVLLS